MTKLLNVYPPPTHVLTKVFIFCFSSSPSLPSLISYFYSTRFIAILSIIFILTLVGLPRYSRKFNSRNLQTIETGIKNFFFYLYIVILDVNKTCSNRKTCPKFTRHLYDKMTPSILIVFAN